MRIYQNKDLYKRTTHCRLCGREGHMWFTCEMPTNFLTALENNKEPDWSLMSKWQSQYWSKKENGELVLKNKLMANCAVWKLQQQKRNERMKEKRATRPTKKSRKKCGFCGKTGHNRRNCSILKDFQKDLERANQNYRKMFYSTMVEEYGLAEGALVQLKAKYVNINNRWEEDWEGIGMIASIDWDKVNLGLTTRGWNFRSEIAVNFVVAGEIYNSDSPFKLLALSDDKVSSLFSEITVSDWGINIEAVLSPSQTLPSKEWFEGKNSECYNYVLKKLSISGVQELINIIERFHPSVTGRGASALKQRIERYRKGGLNGR